jgi:hypothetical protein
MPIPDSMRVLVLAATLPLPRLADAQAFSNPVASAVPNAPAASRPFVIRMTAISNLVAIGPKAVDVSPGNIVVTLDGDCGFLCPAASLRSYTVNMPGLAAGTYQVQINGPGSSRAQLALTVGNAASAVRDYADLWFNPAESGWGLSIHQQGTVIFAVLFVYGPDGKPTWFVAPDLELAGNTGGTERFSGALYRTSGPAFNAAAFDPASVGVTAAGTLTFLGAPDGFGTAEYTIDGASFVKTSLVRQTWRGLSGSASYGGAAQIGLNGTACPGIPFDSPSSITASFSGRTFTLAWTFGGAQCTYTGDYTPSGGSGRSSGTYTCRQPVPASVFFNDFFNDSGAMTLQDIRRDANAFSATFSGTASRCGFSGSLAGVATR